MRVQDHPQGDVVLQRGLQRAEQESKAGGGVRYPPDLSVSVASEPGLGDVHVGRVVLVRDELVISAPSAILPVLLVYQNLVVIDGSASASKTSCGGRRISSPTSTEGGLVSCGVTAVAPSVSGERRAARRASPTVRGGAHGRFRAGT